MKCSMCGDEHCPSCQLRRVGGLCHGPPCHCAGAKTALQVKLAEFGAPGISADEATYLALKMIANNQEGVDG